MTSPDTGSAMRPIVRLENTLRTAVDAFAAKNPFTMPSGIQAVEQRLRETISPGVPLPSRFQCQAVSVFYSMGVPALTLRDLRSLCVGLDHACDACGGKRILDAEDTIFGDFCARLKRSFEERKLEVESWYDLLQSYLRLGMRSTSGGMVQEVLSATLPLAGATSPYPFSWLRAMKENSDLVSRDPCKASARRTLDGKFSELDDLRKSLGIPCTSWFWKELTVACAHQIAQFKNGAFLAAVPEMLQVSRFLPESLRNEILRVFVERCVPCHELGVQTALRDFVVEYWGPPALEDGYPYDLLGTDARRLMQEWIVIDDLAGFMTQLHADPAEGERRLAFWNRYVKSIDYHRILLRPQQEEIPQAERMKQKPSAGRLAGVPDAAYVLLLKIGSWVIVETGEADGAIYGYRYGQLPFALQAEAIAIPCLRNAGPCDFKTIREDTLEGMWEDKLATELATFGIRRDEIAYVPARKKTTPAKKQAASPPEEDAFSETEFLSLAAELQLEVNDLRENGDGLWVTSDLMENHYAVQKLSGWGFSWIHGRGWCRS